MAYSQPTKEENGKKEALDVVNKLYYWPPRPVRQHIDPKRTISKSTYDFLNSRKKVPVDVILRYSEDRTKIIFIRFLDPQFSFDYYKRKYAHLQSAEFRD